MPSGSCFCGALEYEFPSKVEGKVLCHCRDCRKITGSTYSVNAVIPEEGWKWTKGTPKEYKKTADSGKTITSYFCGDCGSTIYRNSDTFGPNQVLKVGTLNDISAMDDAKPAAELFCKERAPWVPRIDGSDEKAGMT